MGSFFVFLCLVGKWFKERLEEREKSMKEIISEYNRSKYDARGIHIKVGTYGAWIEFQLKFKESQGEEGTGAVDKGNSANHSLLVKTPENALNNPHSYEPVVAQNHGSNSIQINENQIMPILDQKH